MFSSSFLSEIRSRVSSLYTSSILPSNSFIFSFSGLSRFPTLFSFSSRNFLLFSSSSSFDRFLNSRDILLLISSSCFLFSANRSSIFLRFAFNSAIRELRAIMVFSFSLFSSFSCLNRSRAIYLLFTSSTGMPFPFIACCRVKSQPIRTPVISPASKKTISIFICFTNLYQIYSYFFSNN